MKVGILTFDPSPNYGCVLQQFALYRTIEKMGYEPWLVSTRKIKRGRALTLKRRFIDFVNWGAHAVLPQYVTHNEAMDLSIVEIKEFVNSHAPNKITPSDLSELNIMNALVVGSDQVWRSAYCDDVRTFFLDFSRDFENVKRVSYAASFGVSQLTPEEYSQSLIDECAVLLGKFDAVSVREESGVDICRDNFGRKDAQWVLDPTMLLEQQEYLPVLPQVVKGKFVHYVLDLDPVKASVIKAIEDAMGTVAVSNIDRIQYSHWASKVQQHRSVESWLSEMASAEFVFTDSFHGCVFCIIFNKPFAVYVNSARGAARFDSLLSLYGLKDRVITDASEIPSLLARPIDWACVNAVRSQMSKYSISFLQNALSKSK